MSEIDIRNNEYSKVDRIRFADFTNDDGISQADVIEFDGDSVNIEETNNGDFVRIHSEGHAKALIKAIEKSIELDWYNFQ